MIKQKIKDSLKSNTFVDADDFSVFLANPILTKRYSIMRECKPYSFGNNIYELNFCFFFYSGELLSNTFYCNLKGSGPALNEEELTLHKYPCNDINRADCWEWVDIM